MNNQELMNLLKTKRKKGRLDWQKGVLATKQNKTFLEVVRRLADK